MPPASVLPCFSIVDLRGVLVAATERESAIRSGGGHPQQLGSPSIKAVMPAITGQGYDGLEIAEGATASMEFVRVHFSGVPAAERQRVRQ